MLRGANGRLAVVVLATIAGLWGGAGDAGRAETPFPPREAGRLDPGAGEPEIVAGAPCQFGVLSLARPAQRCESELRLRAWRPVWVEVQLAPLARDSWRLSSAYVLVTPDGRRLPIAEERPTRVLAVPRPPDMVAVLRLEGQAWYANEIAGSYRGAIRVSARPAGAE